MHTLQKSEKSVLLTWSLTPRGQEEALQLLSAAKRKTSKNQLNSAATPPEPLHVFCPVRHWWVSGANKFDHPNIQSDKNKTNELHSGRLLTDMSRKAHSHSWWNLEDPHGLVLMLVIKVCLSLSATSSGETTCSLKEASDCWTGRSLCCSDDTFCWLKVVVVFTKHNCSPYSSGLKPSSCMF